MSSVIARKWLLKKNYEGTPKREDLEIVEEELPPLKDGGQAAAIFMHQHIMLIILQSSWWRLNGLQ